MSTVELNRMQCGHNLLLPSAQYTGVEDVNFLFTGHKPDHRNTFAQGFLFCVYEEFDSSRSFLTFLVVVREGCLSLM